MLLGEITTHCPTILSLRKAPRGDADDKASSNTCSSWALGQQRQQEGSAGTGTGQLLTHISPTTLTPGWAQGHPQDTPVDAHQDFPLLKRVWTSRVMGTSPSQRAQEGPALPHCRTAVLCPMLFGGVCTHADEKTQPDSGEGVLEWRPITHTCMLAMNMPMCMHTYGTKVLITRADDTLFLSKELFHAITKMMVQEKQLFLAWDSLLQQK